MIRYVHLNIYNFLQKFYFNNWSEKRFELSESPVLDCSDVGKIPIVDIVECQEAVSELGITYSGEYSLDSVPKGCVTAYNYAYWNTHGTGRINTNYFPICKIGGNYKY